jgi:hypothetical protein
MINTHDGKQRGHDGSEGGHEGDRGQADHHLDRIEHLLLAEQKREIEDLKKRMKRLEDALAV